MSNYVLGIVGAGGIARAHVEAIRQIDKADLIAICDISLDRAQ